MEPPLLVDPDNRKRRGWQIAGSLSDSGMDKIQLDVAKWAWDWYQQGYTEILWWEDPQFLNGKRFFVECRRPAA